MSSHNLHNTTITQHMSVLGGGAGCWFTAAPPHQLPPTAPLRQKRHPSASNHQPLSVHHVMHSQQQMSQQQQQLAATTFTPISPPNTFAPISPPGGFTPLSCPQQPLPLSPKTPNGPQHQMMGHMNHHNPHAAMSHSVGVSLHSGQPNNMAMSVQSGLLLAQQPPGGANGSMATSLQTMSGMLQQQSHNISMLQAHHQQLHSTNANVNATQHLNPVIHQQQLQQSSAGIPDINSIQHGLPQALRGAKSSELRLCNMPWHHGKITRERAEQLLQPRTDGLFLVRESTNFPGDQTLCVCFQNRVEHYRIKCGAQSTLTIDDEEFFETLPLLIDHYLQDADGLCTQLVKCLPKQQPPLMTSTQMVPAVASIPPIQQSNQQITNQQTANQQIGNQQLANQQTINQQAQPPPQSIQQQKLQQQSQQNHQQGGQPAQLNQPQNTTAADHNVAPCLAPQAFVDAGWMISERDLEIRENIGKGEFGDVMLGILNGQRVAVKMLKDSEAASKFLAEASLMTSLKHENLVKLLGLVFNKQHICLVTEYMSKGSLVDYLRSRGRLHVTKRDQIMFAFDTCSGMEYLEARRVVHRDLAARNVLVSDTRRAKVADFGLAREEGGPDAAAKLPIKWTAPEALKHNKFSNKSDMWSFGILLWEIYSFGRVPYPRIPLADVVKHVEKGYKMEAPESCPPEVYDLMRQAWDLNPDTRPTFSQLKSKLAQLKANTPLQ